MNDKTNETDADVQPQPESAPPPAVSTPPKVERGGVLDVAPLPLFPPKIASGLVKAQAAAKGAAHDGRNDYHKFNYTSADAVMASAKEALAAGGLAFVALDWDFIACPAWNPDGFCFVVVRYVVTHEDGDVSQPIKYKELAMRGKGRPEDKAIASALTTIQAYAMRGLLNIPRPKEAGDDIAGRDDRGYEPEPQQQPQTTQTRTVPADTMTAAQKKAQAAGKKRADAAAKKRADTAQKKEKAGDKPKGGGKQENADGTTTYQMDPKEMTETAQAYFKSVYAKWRSPDAGRDFASMSVAVFGPDYAGDCNTPDEIEKMTKWLEHEVETLAEEAARDAQDKAAEAGGS